VRAAGVLTCGPALSANCRLELNYAMQEGCAMIPLMMQEGYRPKGWLGLILGAALWYSRYFPACLIFIVDSL
jgi:hypothetical protein